MSHRYTKSTNPFDEDQDDDEEIDDETFLKNSRRTYYQNNNNNNNNNTNPTIDQPNFEQQLQTFQQRKRAIEERTINSTEKSLNILRDSEQIGIATAEELMRQREKLEKTDRQLDEINATLRFSQKHINGIKSVFSSLKNYMSGRNENNPTTNQVGGATTTTTNNESTPTNSGRSTSIPSNDLDEKLSNYDRYENHPATRLRNQGDYSTGSTTGQQQSASKDFSARLDANLQEMCTNISRLKGLAIDMSTEIDSQNDLIGTITDKTEMADMTITKQNKDMKKILKK